jgi:hypothetical protein
MQQSELLLASGIRSFVEKSTMRQPAALRKTGDPMPRTATLGAAPSLTLFRRLMAAIDRLLMASAAIAIRNGDPPYFGL